MSLLRCRICGVIGGMIFVQEPGDDQTTWTFGALCVRCLRPLFTRTLLVGREDPRERGPLRAGGKSLLATQRSVDAQRKTRAAERLSAWEQARRDGAHRGVV